MILRNQNNNKIFANGGSISKYRGLSGALQFAGDNDRIGVPFHTDFLLNGDFSVSMWFICNDITTTQRLVSKQKEVGGITYGLGIILSPTDSRLNMVIYANSDDPDVVGFYIPFTPVVGVLYHIVATKTTNSWTGWNLYINGVLGSKTIFNPGFVTLTTSPDDVTDPPLAFGVITAITGSQFFNGHFLEISWYKKVLTSDEILFIFQSESKIPSTALSSLADQWNFADRSGTTLKGLKGNNGTLFNFANTTLGASNQWKFPYTLLPITS